jgi:dTDP-4-amino-4,6-dideoxygalactose transaminase
VPRDPVSSPRLFLSPPHLSGREWERVHEALASNYVTPLGPMVDALERQFAQHTGIPHCLAVSSGTAAMHLALRGLLDKARRRTERPLVLASTLTFIASVSPATFEGCELVFIDSAPESWNMDPGLLEEELAHCERLGRLPAAVIPTDLFGRCCDLPRLARVCGRHGVPLICDSAEAVGSRYREPGQGPWRHAGYGADAAVFSFNGNKIITTSGGGMLASHDPALIARARKLATQARENVPYYEHVEIGYNYRMSNIAAAIGCGQLSVLEERVQSRRSLFEAYRGQLGGVPGLAFASEPAVSRSNRWLSVVLFDIDVFGATPEQVRQALEAKNIETRPVWKPMHLQPVFRNCRFRCAPGRAKGEAVSEELFRRGLCLPSGSAMSGQDVARVAEAILECAGIGRLHHRTAQAA